MTIHQFHPEVQLLLASLFEVQEDQASGRWLVYLMHPLSTHHVLPPGQEWPLFSGQFLTCEPVPFEQRARGDWAAVPYFKTYDSAMAMALSWANRERKDLVKACQAEALEGLAYRARQERRTVDADDHHHSG